MICVLQDDIFCGMPRIRIQDNFLAPHSVQVTENSFDSNTRTKRLGQGILA